MLKNKDDKIVDLEEAEDKLGPELIDKIADKEWKTAKLPTEEELKKEKSKSSKARNNINSRKNLVQYKKNKPKKVKEKVVKGLKFKKTREDIDPFDYIKIEEDEKYIINAFLPSRKMFRNGKEEKAFYIILSQYLKDFDMSELTASDIEDIMSLSINRIIENRLLEGASSGGEGVSPIDALEDIATTVERFRKHSEKIKGHLAARRSDRIDPRNKQNFSIVDLVYSYDLNKKQEYEKRMEDHIAEEEEYLKTKRKRN